MTWLLWVLFVVLVLAVGIAVWRVWRGPSLADRVVAFDVIATAVAGICALCALVFQAGFFLDVVLIVALLSFVGTLALAHYLESDS